MGVAGVLLGLLGGWIIGAQQVGPGLPAGSPVQATGALQAQGQGQPQAPPPLDQDRVAQLEAEANNDPGNAGVRVQLGNLYFDSERFADAARWYEAALAIDPRNVNVSTDLGIV
jgi:cytochrome c-type biogenesis protein CcmH/NrfG